MNSIAAPAADPASPAEQVESARFGMWVFIAGEVLFFGVLLVAYGVGRVHAPEGFAAASARTNFWLGTLNTALLLSSSCAVAIAAEAALARRSRDSARGLWIAVAFGLAFLAIKGIEWHGEWRDGLFPGADFRVGGRAVAGAELFFAWYFFATAVHALHLLIGVVLCARFAVRSASHGGTDDTASMQALALYWHFVDVVWILLYPLIYLVAPRS